MVFETQNKVFAKYCICQYQKTEILNKIENFRVKFGPRTQERPEIRIFQGKNNPFNPQQSRKLKKYSFSDNLGN